MIGITNFDYKKHKSLVEGFFRLAECGKILKGDSRGHTDGWGIAYYKNGRAVLHKSGGSAIEEKNRFIKIVEKAGKSKIMVLHFRKSSWKNSNTPKNSHPFKDDNIVFCHNGTIYNYKNLLKEVQKTIAGFKGLDSEVYFYFVLNSIALGIEKALKKSVLFIMKHNKYSSLSFLCSDANNLYAYRQFTKSPNYYTLYTASKDKSSIVCSEKVAGNLKWGLMKRGELIRL